MRTEGPFGSPLLPDIAILPVLVTGCAGIVKCKQVDALDGVGVRTHVVFPRVPHTDKSLHDRLVLDRLVMPGTVHRFKINSEAIPRYRV